MHLTHYGPKGKQIISKWEEVDPTETKLKLMDVHGQYYEEPLNTNSDMLEKEKLLEVKQTSKDPQVFGPLHTANEIMNKIENLKKNEIQRIIRSHLNKEIDDRVKEHLKRLFRYLFGSKEGEECYAKFIKEKRVNIFLLSITSL